MQVRRNRPLRAGCNMSSPFGVAVVSVSPCRSALASGRGLAPQFMARSALNPAGAPFDHLMPRPSALERPFFRLSLFVAPQ